MIGFDRIASADVSSGIWKQVRLGFGIGTLHLCNKDVALGIALLDFVGLRVVEYSQVNGFFSLSYYCKSEDGM
jgi:hypothetical protein